MKCMVDGCERPAKSRGLCDLCYQSALHSVKGKKTTWDELVALGLSKVYTTVRARGLFSEALEAKRAEALCRVHQDVPDSDPLYLPMGTGNVSLTP